MRHYDNLLTLAYDDGGWDVIENWAAVPEKIRRKLFKAFPSYMDLADELTLGNGEIVKTEYYVKGRFEFNMPSNSKFYMNRIYDPIDDTMTLMWLHIDPTSQNKGLGKKIMKATADVCDKLGVDMMEMVANEYGSYTWARAGFLPTSWLTLRERMIRKLDMMKIPNELKTEFYEHLESSDPKAIWDIADSRTEHDGKLVSFELLSNSTMWLKSKTATDWHGEFDLKDSESRRRLKNW